MTNHTLTDTEARTLVAEAVRRIVPDADLDAIGDDVPLRKEFELDSLDFLTFAETLSQRSGIEVTENDYEQLVTMRTCVDFMTGG